MKLLFWPLMALPLLALAYHPAVDPRNDQLRPFFPSPYADKGWMYGSDCRWAYAWDSDDVYIGACRYSTNPYTASSKGAQGWAEVLWRKSDWVPVSAVPCIVHGSAADPRIDESVLPEGWGWRSGKVFCRFAPKSRPNSDKTD
jgi:hypothetical protein